MGVRPKVMTVFGIDNYDGPRPDEKLWESQISLSDEEILNSPGLSLSYVNDYAFNCVRKEWQCYCDLIYIGSDEWGGENDGVVGLIQSRDFDGDTFRVLSMLYPIFFTSGYADVPVEKDEWMRKRRLRHTPGGECGGIEFRERWLYPQGYHFMTPVWAFVTKWLLDRLGMETDVGDYKWMLVWEWS